MTLRVLGFSLFALALCLAVFITATSAMSFVATDSINSPQDRAADAAAIRAHIESIFQAFIDGDEDKILATHSEDWRGFLEGSRLPIKGHRRVYESQWL